MSEFPLDNDTNIRYFYGIPLLYFLAPCTLGAFGSLGLPELSRSLSM